MITSSKGVALIKKYEGLRREAYRCPAGVWTIGYGHTADVKRGDVISEYEAERLLLLDLESTERAVEQSCPNLRQCQFDALVSFAFNVGTGNFLRSTMRDKVMRNPSDKTIRDEFLKWNKAGGKELLGLTRRRTEEAAMYFSFNTPRR